MAAQDRYSNKHQKAMEKREREHNGLTNIFVGPTNINVNMPKNGVGTIGDKNVIDAKGTIKDIADDNKQMSLKDLFGLWSTITKIYRAIKKMVLWQ